MAFPDTYKTLRSQGKGLESKIVELPLPKPGKNEVLVKMAFAPIHPADFLTIDGKAHQLSSPIGLEGSGTIAALGEDLEAPHKVGDKVHVLAVDPDGKPRLGTYGEYVLVSAETCTKIQEGLSMEEAACHFIDISTVYNMAILSQKSRHRALIHSVGASHIGRLLIREFKKREFKTINIATKEEDIEDLKKEGADYVLNSQAPDFEARLKEIAEEENATLSFDGIGGSLTGKLLRNQPKNSVCYVYGSLGGEDTAKDILISDLLSGKRVAGFTCFDHMIERNEKGELQTYFYELQMGLPKAFKANIHKVFKFDQLNEAIADYNENSFKGKVLLRFD